jgi:hypothetical protein
MAPSEYEILIEMFYQQMMVIKSLVEVLKAQDLVNDQDLEAYDALISQSESFRAGLRAQVASQIQAAAEAHGVTTGLPYPILDE